MKTQFDHAALLARYVQLVRSRLRGDDMLDEFSGLSLEDRLEIRRISNARVGATGPAFEKTGGIGTGDKPQGKSWFTELNNLPQP